MAKVAIPAIVLALIAAIALAVYYSILPMLQSGDRFFNRRGATSIAPSVANLQSEGKLPSLSYLIQAIFTSSFRASNSLFPVTTSPFRSFANAAA